ncbi:MAG: hypothetical protein RMX96_08050 [Nostoc sp. ChiSLP02]|nr:hypothetical protein [Nostoc sp. DedSLP05]MDZ8102617.1 hypothetical protein [Nostoc sp. DedSLP01]MDZ8184787.1 hypothetical protein [Nostoc sp. ChiSLP02]
MPTSSNWRRKGRMKNSSVNSETPDFGQLLSVQLGISLSMPDSDRSSRW